LVGIEKTYNQVGYVPFDMESGTLKFSIGTLVWFWRNLPTLSEGRSYSLL